VAHGTCSIQQPIYNSVAVQTCRSQSHFLPYMTSSEYDVTDHHTITTPIKADPPNPVFTQIVLLYTPMRSLLL